MLLAALSAIHVCATSFPIVWLPEQIAAGSSDKTIRVWDLATGKALALFKGHKDDVESLDFSVVGTSWRQ